MGGQIKVKYGDLDSDLSNFSDLNELMEKSSAHEQYCYDNYFDVLSKGKTAETSLYETSVMAYSIRQDMKKLFYDSKLLLENVGIVFNDVDNDVAGKLKGV